MTNRTIKFRVYNQKTKKWIHGPHSEACLDGVNLFGENIMFGNLLNGVSIKDLNRIVALQFTGLKDSEGKEIYEGDIIDCGGDSGEYCSVVFDNGCFMTKDPDDPECLIWLYDYNEQCRVVGNIFDNPELIKT
jgi:uncharacterized phage protein (TIGR01671 family)